MKILWVKWVKNHQLLDWNNIENTEGVMSDDEKSSKKKSKINDIDEDNDFFDIQEKHRPRKHKK